MSKNRDIVEEIESKKVRSNYSDKYAYFSRISDIDIIIKKIDESPTEEKKELLRYIPLAIVATAESFFRYAYQQIIDKDAAYLTKAIQYIKTQNIKFDLDLLIALQGKKVSVGEIFAHLLQINSLHDVTSTLTNILCTNFLESVRKTNYSDSLILKFHSRKFKRNFGEYLQSIHRIYKYRHILAHEYAFNISIDSVQLIQDYKNFCFFLQVSEYVIDKKLGTYVPEYQQGMNRYSQNRYKKSQADLNKLLKKIKKIVSIGEISLVGNKRLFNKSFKDWESFRENYSKAFADLFKGGTIAPSIYWSNMAKQTDYLINNLKDEYSIELKML